MLRIYLVGILILFGSNAFAQLTHTQYTQLNEENGLAQNFVYGIVKDKRGFIWISTGDGLTRFDGKTSKIFTSQDGLANNFITTSCLTKSGKILFGHFQGSMSAYNGAYFEKIIGDTLNSEIVSITESLDNKIYCASRSKGLILWDKEITVPTLIFPPELQGKIVNQIKIIGDQLIAATTEGIYTFQVEENNLIFNDAPEELLYEEITAIEAFHNDSLRYWVSTAGKGLYSIRTGTFTKIEQHLYKDVLANIVVRIIVNDDQNSIWLGTHQKGLIHLTLEKDTVVKTIVHYNEDTGYPIFSVNSLFTEHGGATWVGTLSNGIVKLQDPFFRFYDATEKNIKQVNAIVENDQHYYVATNKGLFLLDQSATNAYDYFQILPQLQNEPIISLQVIKEKLWIGTQSKGIQVYDPSTKQLHKLAIPNLEGGAVRARLFEEDKDGNIWIAAMGNGAIQVNIEGKVLQHFATNNGFIHNDIFAICPDAQGNVWFGSLGAGLAKLSNGTLQRLSQEDIFPSHDINDITENNGVIWIATDGQGYFKYDGNVFTKVGPSQELESPFVKSLKADDHQRIWITTRRSVGYLDLQTGKSRYYDRNDGLIEKEDYASPIYLDSRGDLLLANEKGVTVFSTEKVGRPVILNTYLTNISISFSPYLPPAPSSEEMENGIYPSVVLDHDQNHVTFDFRAIDTNYSGRVYYRYYLEGLEEPWSPPATTNSITYTSLEPGTYTFHASATNDLRTWVDQPLQYSFKIEKPYWTSWWFYLLQMVGIVALFGTTYKLIRSASTKRSLGRIMVFMCIFIIFDYLQNWLDPITPAIVGSVPLYKTLLNLCLALILFPVERGIKDFFKR